MSNLENIFRPEVNDFLESADIVVIGGGMIGPSVGFFIPILFWFATRRVVKAD